jgi:hypothetical protein
MENVNRDYVLGHIYCINSKVTHKTRYFAVQASLTTGKMHNVWAVEYRDSTTNSAAQAVNGSGCIDSFDPVARSRRHKPLINKIENADRSGMGKGKILH